MKRRSNDDSREAVRSKLIGLGELSMRKSYFPELKNRINELEKFRALIEQARDILFIIDAASGSFVDVNNAAIRKVGYDREKLFSLTVHNLLPKKNCVLLDLISGNKKISDEFEDNGFFQTELILKNGVSIPVEMTVREHSFGENNYFVVVARDIAKRLKAEKDLKRTRNYLGNVIDSIQSVLVGIDCEMRINLWNSYAEHQTGIRFEDAEGCLLVEILPELKQFEDLITRTVKENYSGEKEIFKYSRNGEVFSYEMVVYPFTGEEGSGAVIRIDDITSRIQMEEVMMQTEKMMTVGGLAAGMAHEINNPLSGILQSSQNILRRFSVDMKANHIIAEECGTDIEKIFEYCTRRGIITKISSIRDMGKRAAKIVSNMLQFSRGSTETELVENITEIVETALELSFSDYDLLNKYGVSGLEIIRDFSDEIPAIYCNPSEMEQVVINLIKNSAQAMKNGVTGERPLINISISAEDSFVKFAISDNGPGMDEDVRKKAIEPFYTTKKAGEGTGLGLFVSYFIVTQKMNGTFSIYSVPDKGTRIEILLPVA
jgi:PAS domain S-box-containing protein